jgi:hypothetical protein
VVLVIVLMALVWIVAVVLAIVYNPGWHFTFTRRSDWLISAAPVVTTVLGMVLTLLAPDLIGKGIGWPRALFVLAFLANVILALAASTWVLSNFELGILLAAPAVVPLLVLQDGYFSLLSPEQWKGVGGLARDWFKSITLQEREAVLGGAGQFVFAVLVLGIVALLPWLGLLSPVPVIMLFLLGLTALYGVFLYVIRRAAFWALGGMVVVGFVAHLQPYRMRFDQLGIYYNSSGLVRFPTLLDGDEETDITRQGVFDELLYRYERADRDLDNVLKALKAAEVDYISETNPVKQKALEMRCEKLRKEVQEKEQARNDLRTNLLSSWNEMEAKNRVRAGRLLPSFLDQLERQEDETGLPAEKASLGEYLYRNRDKKLPLIQTSEIEFWPNVPLKGRRDRRDNVLVVVTVSGGGIRSAYWT